MAGIGELIEFDVRELWKHEQYNFSRWLAKEKNIEYLNVILGQTLIDVGIIAGEVMPTAKVAE